MKNILCYGDSNTWGNIAGSMNMTFMLAKRFPYAVRWTGMLQQLLGEGYRIVEAGLNGRNTSFDETLVVRPSRNGYATLPGILEMHYPLDLVIFMLGTNDVRMEFNASCERIAQGMLQLITYVKNSHLGPDFTTPEVMLIAPTPIEYVDEPAFTMFYDKVSVAKSYELAKHYNQLARQENCAFLDAGPILTVSPADGVHLNQHSHIVLATTLGERLKS